MAQLSYRRHRFPASIIQHAIWLYLRFTLSYRDVEDLLAERGLDISYETVRRWVLKFGPLIARKLRQRRPRPSDRWHLDEMVVRIAGRRMYLWRAVDHEGEILDMLVQRRLDKHAAVDAQTDPATTASDHCAAASALKIRSVDRETRWR
jgi:putative transposase